MVFYWYFHGNSPKKLVLGPLIVMEFGSTIKNFRGALYDDTLVRVTKRPW